MLRVKVKGGESRIKRIRGLRGLPHTAPPQALSPSKRQEVRYSLKGQGDCGAIR